MTATLFDQQTAKMITGEVVNVTQYQFTLIDADGEVLGVFPIDNLPKQ
jgi:hypothetical protein